jgi:hypothetical protein
MAEVQESVEVNVPLQIACVEGDPNRFKELIEMRSRESGSWRGEISKGEVKSR